VSGAFAATPGTWNIGTKSLNVGTSDNRLFATACAPVTSYCVSVGYYRGSSGNDQTLVEAKGAVISSGNANTTNDNILEGVTCVNTTDCWAVGYYIAPMQTGTAAQTLIEHSTSTGWKVVSSPNTGSNAQLYGVTCVTANDCWAVGAASLQTMSVTEHWNGSSWSLVPSPGAAFEEKLNSVACINVNDCWAVGVGNPTPPNTSQAIETMHWNGTDWSIVSSPDPGTFAGQLWGVSCFAANDCRAVGDLGNATLAERYNGSSWSVVSSPSSGSADQLLGG
jgi:uncharacterized membrane protein